MTECRSARPPAWSRRFHRALRRHLVRAELVSHGIATKCPSNAELAEEAPIAHKDIERFVDVVHRAGIARKVARLRPLRVLKG